MRVRSVRRSLETFIAKDGGQGRVELGEGVAENRIETKQGLLVSHDGTPADQQRYCFYEFSKL